ncbi:MAG TPA: LysR family transcriptional regulator [Dongiaceae bacterium]|nr:LysR family transcriptional regulator [Dongiaceae bacterium]
MSLSEAPFRVLDLNLLRVFDALMSEQSVNGAAARLSITPSAVSHALARLRYLLKDQLFVRSPRGMQATPRAAEIGPRLREGLHQLEMALTPLDFVPKESERAFTVGCSSYICAVLMPEVIARLRREAPQATVAIRSWAPGLTDELEGGRVDVLIGDFEHVPERFELDTLFSDRPIWMLGRDYLQPKREGDTPTLLPRLAAMQEGSPTEVGPVVAENGLVRRVALDEQSGVIGVPPGKFDSAPVLATIPYSSVAPLIVKHADMAALLPERLARIFAAHFELDLVPAETLPETRIGAVWHREHGRHPALAWFRELLLSTAKAL